MSVKFIHSSRGGSKLRCCSEYHNGPVKTESCCCCSELWWNFYWNRKEHRINLWNLHFSFLEKFFRDDVLKNLEKLYTHFSKFFWRELMYRVCFYKHFKCKKLSNDENFWKLTCFLAQQSSWLCLPELDVFYKLNQDLNFIYCPTLCLSCNHKTDENSAFSQNKLFYRQIDLRIHLRTKVTINYSTDTISFSFFLSHSSELNNIAIITYRASFYSTTKVTSVITACLLSDEN